ncbi:MAG: hypothetical protein WC410_03665 [Candidatus Paceibacterota bacterium]|jgi:hypothetical protein
MELKSQTISELKQIVEKDYGILLSGDETKQIALSLLRLTRLGLAATARADEQKSRTQMVDKPVIKVDGRLDFFEPQTLL